MGTLIGGPFDGTLGKCSDVRWCCDYYAEYPPNRAGLYRANATGSACYDTEIAQIYLEWFPIISYTACGAWIDNYGKKKFINLRAERQFAYADINGALRSLLYRKRRQVVIVQSRIAVAEAVIAELERRGFK